MENVRGYYDKGKIVVDLRCYLPCHLLVSSFIQQERDEDAKDRYFSPLQVEFY